MRGVFGYLKRRAEYAKQSGNQLLICEAYGAVKMAFRLNAINQRQLCELEEMLASKAINELGEELE